MKKDINKLYSHLLSDKFFAWKISKNFSNKYLHYLLEKFLEIFPQYPIDNISTITKNLQEKKDDSGIKSLEEKLNDNKSIIYKVYSSNSMPQKIINQILNMYNFSSVKHYIMPLCLLKNAIFIDVLPNTNFNISINDIKKILNDNSVVSDYIHIHVGKNSIGKIENTYNQSHLLINSSIFDIILEENSYLSFTNLQNDSSKTHSFFSIIANQKRKSTFLLNNILLNSYITLNYININQPEVNCKSFIKWLLIGSKHQHTFDTIKINHNNDNGLSLEDFKSIYYDNSCRHLDNLVLIRKNIQNIRSHQLSKNLVLSPNVYIKIKPSMKINSGNIRCTHGVVIDKLDKNIIFYMCSRGLNMKVAEDIVLISFVKNLLDSIDHSVFQKTTWFYLKYRLWILK
jgi:Fe-S cluster assembly scaffold protein SufB